MTSTLSRGLSPQFRGGAGLCNAWLAACEEAGEGGGVMASRCDEPNEINAFAGSVPCVCNEINAFAGSVPCVCLSSVLHLSADM